MNIKPKRKKRKIGAKNEYFLAYIVVTFKYLSFSFRAHLQYINLKRCILQLRVKMIGRRLEKFPLWLSWSCSQPWSSWHISSLRWQTWASVLRFQARWGLLAVTCSVASHDKRMIHGPLPVSPWLAFFPSLFTSPTDSLRTRVSKVCESRGSGPQRRTSKWKGICSFQPQM